MNGYCFTGRFEKGSLKLDKRPKFLELAKRLEGKKIMLCIEEFVPLRTISQNRYYHGVVVKMMASHLGYKPDEMHEALKMKFLGTHEDGELPSCRSTTDLDVKEFGEFLENVIQLAAESGLLIPLPGEMV